MNTKLQKLIRDIFVFGLGNVGSKLILFFLVPLYTNYLTKAEYGTADLVFTISQVLIPLFSVTVFDAVVRFGLVKSNRPENVLLCAFRVFGIGAVILFAITPLFRLYPAIAPWRWYLSIYTTLSIGVYVELNYLKVLERNLFYSIAGIIQTLVLAGMNIVLIVYCRLGVSGYILSNIIACFITFLLIFFVGRIGRELKKASFQKDLLKQMLIYSAPLILNNISWWIIHASDKVMLELMMGAAVLGIYTVASKIPSLINVFISIFSQAWGLSAIREFEGTKDDSLYTEVFSRYSVLAFFAAACLNTLIKPFMQIYVGADFQNAWKYVPLLLVSAVFSAIAAYYGSMYGALKKSKNNMWTTLTAAVVNIVVNFFCIRWFGIWGAVIGTVSAYIVVAFARIIDVQRMIQLHVSWARFLISCLIIVLQALAVSFGFFPYAVSALCLMCLTAVNLRVLRNAAVEAKEILHTVFRGRSK